MARRSTIPKTPKAQIIHSNDDEEEGVNEDTNAVGQGSELDVDPATDGKVRLPLDNLPNITSQEPFSSPAQRSHIVNMGNEQSRATNSALRSTAHTLQNESGGSAKSTGKLKRPSIGRANPAYRNPVPTQRRMGPETKARIDPYNNLESPEKLSPAKTRVREQQEAQFSPRRADRRKAAAVTEQAEPNTTSAAESQSEAASPRKSRRQQGLPEERADMETIPEVAEQQAAVEEGVNLDDPEVVKYKTWFREVLIHTDEEQDDDIGENIDVAEPQKDSTDVEAEEGKPEQPAQPKSRGRPKKVSSEHSPEQKRGPGRPKKSDEAVASKTPRKTKSQGKSAVESLKRKRLESAPDVDEDDGIDGIIQDQPRGPPRLDKLRPSQVFPDDLRGLKDFQAESPQKKRARRLAASATARMQAHVNTAPANTARKRKRAESDASDEEEESSLDSEANQRRLYGQWLPLQTIFNALGRIGSKVQDGKRAEKYSIELEDDQIGVLIELCKEAKKRFTKLKDLSGQIGEDSDPATILHAIDERVEGLRGNRDEYPTDFTSKRKSASIYYHLIPELVKLVRHAVICYLEIDKDSEPTDNIKMSHLRIVADIIALIVDLIKDANHYARPDTNLRVVQPVRNDIGAPLRKVLGAFNRVIRDHEYGLQERRRQENDARYDAERLAREEQESRQQAKIQRLQDKWNRLHDERMWAEGGFPKTKKREHLQIPSNLHVELDHNGDPFSRAEAFVPRVGPTPGKVDEAASKEWTIEELSALHDGLKQYAGPNVFERIFRRYCGVGRELNRYNVTEIVTVAAMMREGIVAEQKRDEESDGKGVEDWVLAIPIWTKAQTALGKENEDSFVDLTAET